MLYFIAILLGALAGKDTKSLDDLLQKLLTIFLSVFVLTIVLVPLNIITLADLGLADLTFLTTFGTIGTLIGALLASVLSFIFALIPAGLWYYFETH